MDLAASGGPEFYWDSARLALPLANARRAQGELIGMARLLDPASDLRAHLKVLTSDGVAVAGALVREVFAGMIALAIKHC